MMLFKNGIVVLYGFEILVPSIGWNTSNSRPDLERPISYAATAAFVLDRDRAGSGECGHPRVSALKLGVPGCFFTLCGSQPSSDGPASDEELSRAASACWIEQQGPLETDEMPTPNRLSPPVTRVTCWPIAAVKDLATLFLDPGRAPRGSAAVVRSAWRARGGPPPLSRSCAGICGRSCGTRC